MKPQLTHGNQITTLRSRAGGTPNPLSTTKKSKTTPTLDYFGVRYYHSGLRVWLSVDALAGKYPSLSPYNYCSNNPIMLIDPDGMENIVVVGNQNDSPNIDTKYEDSRHFLEAGLAEAKSLSSDGENTTMLVYKGNYTKKELRKYKKLAQRSNINFVIVNDAVEVINYINDKRGRSDPRSSDLITNLSIVSHGNSESLFLGNGFGSGKRTIFTEDVLNLISSNSFTKTSVIKLNSCRAANSNYGTNIADAFAKKGGTVLATYNSVNWGPGLGEFKTHIPDLGGKQWYTINGSGGINGPVQQRIQRFESKSPGSIPISIKSPIISK